LAAPSSQPDLRATRVTDRRVRGRVTADGHGHAGVLVTDGTSVTATGHDGTFGLPGAGPFIAITRPTGWKAARWYLPIDAPEHHFELTADDQPLPVAFVQVTDLHVSLGSTDPGPDGSDATIWFDADGMQERVVTSPAVLAQLWVDIADQVPDAVFIAATGDLTNTGSDAEYAAWIASTTDSVIPVVGIPGNHDHHAQDGELLDDGASVDFHAVPDRYEGHLGPRWFSFDHAGLHVVAIDWFTHLLGIDAARQDAWLAADLAALPAHQPVVLLSHDQMPSEFFARLPRQPIATFSGHWHTSRVARVHGTLHVNTPTATFGGLDYSPAAFRIARWDGTDLTVETVVRSTASGTGHHRHATYRGSPSAGAFAQLPGAGHRGGPVLSDDLVIATSRDEDRPAGWLTAIDASSGEVAWQVSLDSAVKSSPAVAGDAIVATAVTGETVCVARDGEVRWRRHIDDDPLRLWTYLQPAADDRRVYVGDVARFVALDLATGDTVWERDDLGQRENLTSCADPAIVDGTLLVAFAGQTPVLHGLDPCSGTSRWPRFERAQSIYRLPPSEVATELVRTVVAPIVADGDDAYVVRLGGVVERLRARDGATVWLAAHRGWFNPGRGAVAGDLVVFATGDARVRAYRRDDGELVWETVVGIDAPIAGGAYRSAGPLTIGGVTATATGLVVATGDGALVRLSHAGDVEGRLELPAPALGGVTVAGERAWTVTADGGLHRLSLT